MAFILNRRGRDPRASEPPERTQNTDQLLSAADTARDSRRWADAAKHYRQYLAICAEDAPVWVQLGHALKEAGRFDEAETAYKQSLSLAPQVADTQLQLGHLHKKMRNFEEAIAAYAAAARLDETLIDAQRELNEFGLGPDAASATAASSAGELIGAREHDPPRAQPGRIYRLGHQGDLPEFIACGDAEFADRACDASWDAAEDFGRWMRGSGAMIAFVTANSEDEVIQVLVEVFTAAGFEELRLRLAANGTDYPAVLLEGGARRFLLLEVKTDNGRAALEFSIDAEIAATDTSQYRWLGSGSIGYAPLGDALSRVALLEDVITGMPNMTTMRPCPSGSRAGRNAQPLHEAGSDSEAEPG